MEHQQKFLAYKIYFLAMAAEGCLALLLIFWESSEAHNRWLLGYSLPRLLIGAGTAILTLAFFGLAYKAFTDGAWLDRVDAWFASLATNRSHLSILGWAGTGLVLMNIVFWSGASISLPAPIHAFIARFSPLWVWGMLGVLQTLAVLALTSPATRKDVGRAVLVGSLVVVLAVLYWHGAERQLVAVNVMEKFTDQSAYMNFAQKVYESGFRYLGDFNRMPLYPFLQALFYRPEMKDFAFFTQGKYLNLLLSIGLLAGLAAIFRRYFNSLHTLVLILIIAFTVFIFKAGWFQTELLFYFLNFCLFLMMWRLLSKPSLGVAVLAGVVAGLAHLTKASILPGLLIFLVFAALQGTLAWIKGRRAPGEASSAAVTRVRLLTAPIVGLVFLVTVFPYIQNSKRLTGRYFYNVNSTFYIWYDSWEQATQGTRAYGDRVGWPDMPSEEIPSALKYLREHTPGELVERMVDGTEEVMAGMLLSYGYFKYLEIYMGALILAAAFFWERTRERIHSDPLPLLFVLLYFVVYFCLYAWYAPINSGNRLILAQFIPLLFIVSLGLKDLLDDQQVRLMARTANPLTALNLAMLALLAVNIAFLFILRVGSMYGGY